MCVKLYTVIVSRLNDWVDVMAGYTVDTDIYGKGSSQLESCYGGRVVC